MARPVLLLIVVLGLVSVLPSLAQLDCDDESDNEVIQNRLGFPCDASGPRVCGGEEVCGWRGPCSVTGRDLVCISGRCVVPNDENVGYPCEADAPHFCGGGTACRPASTNDVASNGPDGLRCRLVAGPDSDVRLRVCSDPLTVCQEGFECMTITCGPWGCAVACQEM